jgi:alpha-beta hydrolase superfamily lysophospholipase
MSRWLTLLVVLASLQPVFPTYAADDALSGSWTGTWARDGDVLTVSMHFVRQNSGWVASFDSERLRVIGIPLRDISVAFPRVTWKIVGDATTMNFAGELSEETLAGEFEEKGARGTFQLKRVRGEAPQIEERAFAFKNGDVALAGTLLLPPQATRKVPAVVFLHGSGAEGRWASRYLATRFTRGGMAALIFDKRGVGESRGDWRTATYDDLAGDAAAAVDALRKDAAIDPDNVGIHGHSQGGTLAPLVAAKAHAAFVIASAAAGLPPDQVEIYSLENSVRIASLSAEDAELARRYITTLVGVAYRGEPGQQLSSVWEQVRGKPWAFQPPADDSHYWSFSRNFNTFEPATHWRKVAVPVLLVYGALDKRVPPRQSAARIAQATLEAGGNSVSVRIFEDADHTFRVRSPNLVWPTTVQGYPDLLIEWTRRVTRLSETSSSPTPPDQRSGSIGPQPRPMTSLRHGAAGSLRRDARPRRRDRSVPQGAAANRP